MCRVTRSRFCRYCDEEFKVPPDTPNGSCGPTRWNLEATIVGCESPYQGDWRLVNHIVAACCLNQVSPNFFVRGPHKLLQNISRAGRLTSCDCFGICYILPNQQNVGIFFIIWQNCFAGQIWPTGRSLETPGLNQRELTAANCAYNIWIPCRTGK